MYSYLVETSIAALEKQDQDLLDMCENIRRAYAEEYFPIPHNPIHFSPYRLTVPKMLPRRVYPIVVTSSVVAGLIAILFGILARLDLLTLGGLAYLSVIFLSLRSLITK